MLDFNKVISELVKDFSHIIELTELLDNKGQTRRSNEIQSDFICALQR